MVLCHFMNAAWRSGGDTQTLKTLGQALGPELPCETFTSNFCCVGYLQQIIRKLTSHTLVDYDIFCTFLIELNTK